MNNYATLGRNVSISQNPSSKKIEKSESKNLLKNKSEIQSHKKNSLKVSFEKNNSQLVKKTAFAAQA